VFAVDRIRSVDMLEETFQLPDEGVLDRFMETSFGVFQGTKTRVKIRFAPEVAGYIREKIWHATQELTELKDGALLFEAEVAGTEEIKHWVLQWGAHAEVVSPTALRRSLRKEAVGLLAQYDNEALS
jgi:predicted DNA-binding transcriptional regulator YafY